MHSSACQKLVYSPCLAQHDNGSDMLPNEGTLWDAAKLSEHQYLWWQRLLEHQESSVLQLPWSSERHEHRGGKHSDETVCGVDSEDVVPLSSGLFS